MRPLIVARTGRYRTENIFCFGLDSLLWMWYHADMNDHTNDYPSNETELVLPYDDCDLDGMSDSEIRDMLEQEGYTTDEIDRMMGDYEADDYCYGDDDLDRDVPDFVDDGDFE